MRFYRIYLCDQRGRVKDREEITVATDAEAIAFAFTIPHPHGIEVWDGARQVRVITPDEPRPGAG